MEMAGKMSAKTVAINAGKKSVYYKEMAEAIRWGNFTAFSL
jgi:hypothetical protein